MAARGMASHWSNLEAMVPSSKKTEFSAKVAELRKRQEAAMVPDSMEPIDWASFAERLGDKGPVDTLKAEFEKHQYTDFEANKATELAELSGTKAATLSDLTAKQSEMSEFAADASAQLSELRAHGTSTDTELDAVLARYPEIAAECEADIDSHMWDSDNVAPVDVHAKRVALIKERWNAGAMGSLDEATMKEFLDEVEAGSGAGASAGELMSAEQRAGLKALCEEVGSPVPSDAQMAEWWVESGGDGADMDSRVYPAGEAGEICEIGEFDAASIEGKSAAELLAMAEAAHASENYYAACALGIAAKTQTGELDRDCMDPNTHSGMINFFTKLFNENSAQKL